MSDSVASYSTPSSPRDIFYGRLPGSASYGVRSSFIGEFASHIQIVDDISRRLLSGRRICHVSKRKGSILAFGTRERQKKIVLIHGLSIPAIIWKDVAPVLAARGFRVLLYDLYGRGYSEAPQTTYDTNLYTTQLAHLMQYLRWEKANIVGVSMGGAIAAAFTSHFPHLVDEGVALIASAGIMESSDISRTAKFMSSPLVQTLTSSKPARTYIQRLTNQTEDQDIGKGANVIIEIVRLQSAHLPGYNAALSSSLRDGPIRGQSFAFKSKGFEDKRVLIIHGTEDTTVHPRYSPLIAALLPASTQKN